MGGEKMKRTFLKRAGRRNRHHIHPKSRGGTRTPENLILMDETRHSAFHLLFGNRNFREAARVLLRADRIKKKLDKEWEKNFETNYG
jgi:hypothetical protein